MKWRTKTGQIVELSSLSHKHLINAIKQQEAINDSFTNESLCALLEEKKRRENEKFFAQTNICPWCSNTMIVRECQQPIEVGFSFPEYAFVCSNCSSTGPKFKR